MKRFFTLISIAIAAYSISSSEEITIESKGEEIGTTTSAYYNLSSRDIQIRENDDWDLAFDNLAGQTAVIRTHRSYSVFVVPNSDYDTFGTVIDTTGMVETWEQGRNSNEDWMYGSLNLGKGGFLDGIMDYGWGTYSFSNHFVLGDKVFVITNGQKSYQLLIDGLYSGTFVFKWAELDGSLENEVELDKDNGNSLLKYYDFETGNTFTMPEIGTWDIVLDSYVAHYENAGFYYPAGGIRTSPTVLTAEVITEDPISEVAPDPSSELWTRKITEIGHDWKSFTGGGYTIKDDVAYFVQRVDTEDNPIGEPFKIVPVNYASNTFVFMVDPVGSVFSAIPSVDLSPNTVSVGENINLPNNMFNASIRVFNMNGVEVYATQGNAINTNNLATGKYFVIIDDNSEVKSSQFIVE